MAAVDFGVQYKRFVRYFWDPEPKNDDLGMNPIWCLGQKYAATEQTVPPTSQVGSAGSLPKERAGVEAQASAHSNGYRLRPGGNDTSETAISKTNLNTKEPVNSWPSDFLDDFESRFWFTYRSHFSPIRTATETDAPSLKLAVRIRSQFVDQEGFTSDTGWGCMIRSGQCLIANALAILKLGRHWRRGTEPIQERHLLSLFADDPRAPFSLHRFVEHGASACGKHPGEWFGPSATSRCIQALSHEYSASGLKVYVNGDGPDVYEDTLFQLAKNGGDGAFCPVLVLVGVRLGIDRVTPVYWEALKRSLQLSQSMGIAGGRPSASHYFVGVQGDNFFYLDPHQTRPKLPYQTNLDGYTEDDIASCHTRRLRRIHVDQMDPSMLLAFLIRDETEWREWRNEMTNVPGKPVLHIADREPTFHLQHERDGAIDEVETYDDEDEDSGDGELINLPTPS